MPQYKLTYFNARGRGEVARILFAVTGQEYEDKRLEMNMAEMRPGEEFMQMKPCEQTAAVSFAPMSKM